MHWILRGLITLEVARFLAWLVLLVYVVFWYSPEISRLNEAMMFVGFGVFYLGFPYTWAVPMFFENWNDMLNSSTGLAGVVVFNLLVWFLGTAFLARVLWSMVKNVLAAQESD